MGTLLVLIALVVALWSALHVTNATLGVWMVCCACLAGILARLAQAQSQHKEITELVRAGFRGSGALPESDEPVGITKMPELTPEEKAKAQKRDRLMWVGLVVFIGLVLTYFYFFPSK